MRKHIERICEEFGLDDDNQEGRRYRRSDLVALVAKHKPELMEDRTFKNTKEMIVGETAKNTGIISLAHYNLALTFERLSDKKKKKKHYEIAMKQSNRAAVSATNNLARLEIRQKIPEAAVRLIEPILLRAQDPAVKASLYKNLGWAYYELKRYKEAKENLLKSIEFRIDYAPAYYLLGKVQELIDDKESALSSFREFLKYDDNQPKTIGKEWRVPELEDWYFEVVKYLKEHSK